MDCSIIGRFAVLTIPSSGGPKAVDIVAVLLDSRGNPNVKSADGLTPLHIAAMWGHLQVSRLFSSFLCHVRYSKGPEVFD